MLVNLPLSRAGTHLWSTNWAHRAKSFPSRQTMEALRGLEQVQKMLSLIQRSNLSSQNHDSDRFLADFLLFMVNSSRTLDMETKYNLVSENIPKISPALLGEALACISGQGTKAPAFEVSFGDNTNLVSTETAMHMAGPEDMPMIGLDSMQRANSTLEDFCRSYFMFHGMDVNRPESVFKYLPVLSFTEGYIYQLDTLNEEVLSIPQNIGSVSIFKADFQEKSRKLTDDFVRVFKSGAFKPLTVLLDRRGLLTDRIREELSYGEEYWALERKLCHALIRRKEILIEDVMRAIHLKSFDYRVLNLLLYQLRESQVNEMHMEFLSTSEFLVEISDDLFDYEEDVIENNFNILRMFIGVYGASVAPVMLAKCITEAEEKYESLLKDLDPELSLNYRRRCEEATKEGGSRAGNSLGTWSIPPVIADEEFYRSNEAQLNCL